jgi:cellulose synthase/poly-beta-1,6-N-acetylglucosamine synthase-like glycosyltransferase
MVPSALWSEAILVCYFAVLIVLALFGIHRYRMVYLYFRHRDRRPGASEAVATLPKVTVQLPVYNELYVVERLIDAAASLDYPRELLEIQVLDDSSDETSERARARVELHRRRGIDIHHLRRPDRAGFKAGALRSGLAAAKGEILAVFDADFVPGPEFLRETVPYFADREVGMVQARWGHLNDGYSLLTRIQAVLLDAHFVVEHGGRNRGGAFFNFNGTAGLWRREAIEAAGGWQPDTLTEDLDLSYRAQLAGYRFLFLPDVVAPGEIPVSIAAFKSQQQRWAKGSIQTARKLLPRILASPLPVRVKTEAFFHLTANLAYPLMMLLSLLLVPSMLLRYETGLAETMLFDLPLFLMATASVTGFYVVSQRELYPDWRRRLQVLPMLMALGIGMSLSNGRAVLEGLFGRTTSFERTPKYGIESSLDRWKDKRYRGRRSLLPLLELGAGIGFTIAVAYAASHQILGSIPFLLLFQAGFLYTGSVSIWEAREAKARYSSSWFWLRSARR